MESTLSASCATSVLTSHTVSTSFPRRLPGTLLSCVLAAGVYPAQAGVFSGYQANAEDNRFGYIGWQHASGSVVYELFAAHLEYTYLDGGAEVSATQRIVTPTVGWRWKDDWTVTAMIGPTFVAKEEEGARTTDDDSIGAMVKASVYSWQPELTRELLVSFTTLDRLLWGRARMSRALDERFALGGEVVGMSGETINSHGLGLLASVRGGFGQIGVNVGWQRSTNREDTVYGGLELSAFF